VPRTKRVGKIKVGQDHRGKMQTSVAGGRSAWIRGVRESVQSGGPKLKTKIIKGRRERARKPRGYAWKKRRIGQSCSDKGANSQKMPIYGGIIKGAKKKKKGLSRPGSAR